MTNEFKYLKEGLTSDIVKFLMEDYGLDLHSALSTVYDSATFSRISFKDRLSRLETIAPLLLPNKIAI